MKLAILSVLLLAACSESPAPPSPDSAAQKAASSSAADVSAPIPMPTSAPLSAPTNFLPPDATPAEPAIEVNELPESRFSYKHEFIKRFLDGYTVRVIYDLQYANLPPDASIEQPDGKWVVFSIDDPADKIIRDEPLKDIKIAIPKIEHLEKSWHRPNCVTDEDHQLWCLK